MGVRQELGIWAAHLELLPRGWEADEGAVLVQGPHSGQQTVLDLTGLTEEGKQDGDTLLGRPRSLG